MKADDFSGIRNNGPLPNPQNVKIPANMADLLKDYVDSAVSMLDELERAALAYEAGDNRRENGAALRRILHKLKGESGMVGVNDIEKICHEAENAFEELPEDKRPDMLLRVKDWVNTAIHHLTGQTVKDFEPHKSRFELAGSSKIKCLIVEDDFITRKLLQTYLADYADCFIAVNGREAAQAVRQGLDEGESYELICLDIMMPEMDGHEALKAIRRLEKQRGISGLDGVKVIMVTALSESRHIISAFRSGCEAYIVKPVRKEKLLEEIEKLGLLSSVPN